MHGGGLAERVRELTTEVQAHDHDATGRDGLLQFPLGTLGDIIAWHSYAACFGPVHRTVVENDHAFRPIPLQKVAP